MDQNKEMLELLKQINENTRKQVFYGRLRCLFAVASACCFAGILFMLYRYLPQMAEMVVKMQTVLGNLERVTKDLAAVDFGSMVNGINTLVETGQLTLEQTVSKLNTIDFTNLNKAIKDLADVVEPVAKFFNTFR